MSFRAAPAASGAERAATSVLLGDAHPLFRSGMRYLLNETSAPVEIVEAGSRAEALAHLEQRSFDLVLASLFSVEGDWEDFLAALLERAPLGRLIILSGLDDPIAICRILAAGAAGFVLKETPPNVTLNAIRLVLAGGVYVPASVLRVLSAQPAALDGAHPSDPVAGARAALTERQEAVLRLIAQGASNKAIARALDLSAGTVKGHVASLLRIYGAETRVELAISAAKSGAPPPAPETPSGF